MQQFFKYWAESRRSRGHYRFYLALLIACPAIAQQTIDYPSGDPELDSIRLAVREHPTTHETFKLRAYKMKLWVVSLQQQGARMPDYLPIDAGLRSEIWWNNVESNVGDGSPQPFTDAQMRKLADLVDRGYAILDKVQQNFATNPPNLVHTAETAPIDPATQPEIPWTHYKGNASLSGYTGARGPTRGEQAWRFPVGLSWESQPVVEDDRVYVSSPGMRTLMYCLDLETGAVIWDAKQVVEIMGDQLYNTPNNQSTPVVLEDYVLFRELGARGNKGPTKHIVFLNKKTGKIEKDMLAGHVDYRAGHAPLAANERFTVFSHGTQDIHETPPVAHAFNRVIGRDTKTGNKLWDFNVGYTFAEPLLDSNQVFVGTQTGYLYSWHADRQHGHRPSAEWQFRAGGAINERPAVKGNRLLFGANDGVFYCLNKQSGELLWKYRVDQPETRAFRHFSSPYVTENLVVFGGADQQVYGLDIASGKPVFVYEADDWVRAQPVVQEDEVFFATMAGTLYGINYKNNTTVFEKKLTDYPILADLTLKDDKLLVNDTDLYVHCLTTAGDERWKRSLIDGFGQEEVRILSDQIAGGAYYQSKPTAADGKVFFGTPSRFVYAVDAQTGQELWKFEMGAAISGAPTYADGRLYVGQQGGEDAFYCLDAETGQQVWTADVGWVWGSANVSDGMVYVPDIEGYAMGLDATDGSVVWDHRFAKSVCSEPAVEGDQVVFGSWDNYLIAFDKKTGKVNWQFQGGGTDSGVAIMVDGKIYLKNKCVDAKTGKLVWEFNEPGSVFNITPAYHDGQVYLSCWHGLGLGGICVEAVVYCLDAETGALRWRHEGGGLSSPVIGEGGNVYFPSIADPYFYCVDAKGNGDGTTSTKWVYKMGNKVEESTPALYKGKAYIMSSDGYVHAIQ